MRLKQRHLEKGLQLLDQREEELDVLAQQVCTGRKIKEKKNKNTTFEVIQRTLFHTVKPCENV